MPGANLVWTTDQDLRLGEMVKLGMDLSQISHELNRSVGSVRMRAARLGIELRKSGKLTACPAWLELNDDRTQILFVPERAMIVRTIFEMSAAGVGGYTIANRLNAQGVPVFGPGSKWDQSTIHNLLRNRATLGEFQPKRYEKRPDLPRDRKGIPEGDAVRGYYPPVIDEELFERAQISRRENLAHGRGRKGALVTNLFGNIATCAYCSAPIKFYSNGADKSLICANVLAKKRCPRFGWTYRNFERSFFAFIENLAEPNLARSEQEGAAILRDTIRKLSVPEVFDVRLELSTKLKSILVELRIWSCSLDPGPIDLCARIRRDHPDRMFMVRLGGGAPRKGVVIR